MQDRVSRIETCKEIAIPPSAAECGMLKVHFKPALRLLDRGVEPIRRELGDIHTEGTEQPICLHRPLRPCLYVEQQPTREIEQIPAAKSRKAVDRRITLANQPGGVQHRQGLPDRAGSPVVQAVHKSGILNEPVLGDLMKYCVLETNRTLMADEHIKGVPRKTSERDAEFEISTKSERKV